MKLNAELRWKNTFLWAKLEIKINNFIKLKKYPLLPQNKGIREFYLKLKKFPLLPINRIKRASA